jgi:CelD/BcsL family acetyltransferase involved in cellulose biosynthesis
LAREAATNAQYHVYAESSEAAPYVTTEGSWTEYEAGLRRKFRGELRRRRKRLGDEGRLALEVYDGREDLEKLLEEGFRIEGSGWKESHRTSINTNPALQRFYTDIARWAAERDWLRLAFLRINDRAVAFDYCFECDGTHYLQKTGYETAYRKFAPGVIMRQLMLERAFFSSDIVAYDFLGVGLGAESAAWKREWTNRQQDRLFMHIFSPTALGVCDRAVFEASNKGLDVAKKLVRNSALDERYRRALRRAYETMHSKLSR